MDHVPRERRTPRRMVSKGSRIMVSKIRFVRLVLVTLVALGALAIAAPAALAAAPSNDTFGGATTATIGFSQVLDTTQATTDSDDAQLNASCGAPATDASVWYSLAGTDAGVVVDVSQSDYSAGVSWAWGLKAASIPWHVDRGPWGSSRRPGLPITSSRLMIRPTEMA